MRIPAPRPEPSATATASASAQNSTGSSGSVFSTVGLFELPPGDQPRLAGYSLPTRTMANSAATMPGSRCSPAIAPGDHPSGNAACSDNSQNGACELYSTPGAKSNNLGVVKDTIGSPRTIQMSLRFLCDPAKPRQNQAQLSPGLGLRSGNRDGNHCTQSSNGTWPDFPQTVENIFLWVRDDPCCNQPVISVWKPEIATLGDLRKS